MVWHSLTDLMPATWLVGTPCPRHPCSSHQQFCHERRLFASYPLAWSPPCATSHPRPAACPLQETSRFFRRRQGAFPLWGAPGLGPGQEEGVKPAHQPELFMGWEARKK